MTWKCPHVHFPCQLIQDKLPPLTIVLWGSVWLTFCLLDTYLISCTIFSVSHNSLKSQESIKQHLNPLKLLFNVENVMSNNSIIVADGGDFVGTAAYILR